jgi:hypothetical protein
MTALKIGFPFALSLTLAFILAGCGKPASQTSPPTPGTPAEATPATPGTPASASPSPAGNPPITTVAKRVPVSTNPPPKELWKEFSGDRAFAAMKAQVDIGPRPSGSSEIEKARIHITSELEAAGWEVERQDFTDTTPRGVLKFANLIARFSTDGSRPVPQTTQRAILCSHYDTKRFSTIRFVGASDGASSTGSLLEAARVLALDPQLAAKLELVFFDGEEALVQFNDTDGLYGSRHYATKLRDSGRNRQFLFGILWDMIGDASLTVTLPPDSPPELSQGILSSAETLGVRSNFTFFDRQIKDDHVSLITFAHIPTIDIIDFDYLWWHTADDTLEHQSPKSLHTVGAVTLHYVVKKLR